MQLETAKKSERDKQTTFMVDGFRFEAFMATVSSVVHRSTDRLLCCLSIKDIHASGIATD